jgi:hypothetical protein
MQTDVPGDHHFYDREMSESPSQSNEQPPPSPHCSMSDNLNANPQSSLLPVNSDEGPQTQGSEGPQTQGSEGPQTQGSEGHHDDMLDDGMGDDISLSQNSISSISSTGSMSPPSSPSRDPCIWSPAIIRIPDSVTDASRHQLCMDRFFHPSGLMQPREQDLNSLDANGKAWVMERPPSSLLIDGNTWSFVDECHAGITSELLKVLYFFDIVNGMSNHFHWNGFVAGTTDISGNNQNTYLKPSYAPNKKDVNGVVLSQYIESDESISFKGSRSGVDTGKLLTASEHSASGTVYTPMELFRISISFTAAVFESNRIQHKSRRHTLDYDDSDEQDESRQAIFGVVTVTTLRNVDTLRLVMVFSIY